MSVRRRLIPLLAILAVFSGTHGADAGVADEVRRLQQGNNSQRAYDLAVRNRGAASKAKEREAAFLAGWIALRDLNRPADAVPHFRDLFRNASGPATKAKGAYWLGRSAEALRDRSSAISWYRVAAANGFTFYGQAAAARLGVTPTVKTHPGAHFDRNDLVLAATSPEGRKAVEAAVAGRERERDAALRALARAGTPKSRAVAAALARVLGAIPTSVSIARAAADDAIPLIEAGYPTVDIPWHDGRVRKELVFAVIREESGFAQEAVSSANAVGLMQVTKAAADHSGQRSGARVEFPKVRADAGYNIAVGSHYLGMMLDRYRGTPILAIAAYNAGPGRVDRWLEQYGDPRSGVDPVDWIESIPFDETRNYVKRVMSSYITYLAAGGAG